MTNLYMVNFSLSTDVMEKIKKSKVNYEEEKNEDGLYLIKFQLKGNTKVNANKLDKLQELLKSKYKADLLIIKSDSSKFYNEKLYVLVNSMERNLREMLYLAIFLVDKEHGEEIKNLEKLDFNELYKLLFIDPDFMKYAIDALSEGIKDGKRYTFKNYCFTKEQLLTLIQEREENILWDNVFPKQKTSTLKDHFYSARNHRNSVMHAHNITRKQYEDGTSLYEKIIEELDNQIFEMKKEPSLQVNSNIGELIKSTLNSLRIVQKYFESIPKIIAGYDFMKFQHNDLSNRWKSISGLSFTTSEIIANLSSVSSSFVTPNLLSDLTRISEKMRLGINLPRINYPENQMLTSILNSKNEIKK